MLKIECERLVQGLGIGSTVLLKAQGVESRASRQSIWSLATKVLGLYSLEAHELVQTFGFPGCNTAISFHTQKPRTLP